VHGLRRGYLLYVRAGGSHEEQRKQNQLLHRTYRLCSSLLAAVLLVLGVETAQAAPRALA
jgi:hypothetical protein